MAIDAPSTRSATDIAPRIHTGSSLSLDSLATRSLAELEARYRAAPVPTSMRAADGELPGRMLAVRGLPGPIARPIARWAGSRSFLWEGKTFRATSDRAGVGHNRLVVRGVLGRQNLFPFATSFGPSAIDGAPTLILDYDLADNPGFIRAVHDEVREVEPGLFLGPAMWKSSGRRTLVLYFALDARLA
jgi:hypothetical protein